MNNQSLSADAQATAATRIKLACGTVSITILMIAGFVLATPGTSSTPLGVLYIGLFSLLTGWIAFGFCVAMSGTRQFLFGKSSSESSANAESQSALTAIATTDGDHGFEVNRIALLVPIYNEDPAAVMACVQASAESLGRTGQASRYDIFILSDTTKPDVWIREEMLWSAVRSDMNGAAPAIHYRHRVENRGRKAGNIGEFLERWGLDYKYFVILDADSTMDGHTLTELARRMDANDRLGILQSPPIPEGRESLWARVQQFSARAYGPLFNYGLIAWTGAEGNYWGHNAMIRTHAFLRHCGLSRLPGPEPLGGEVLSHDFVEAALMRRAGYEVRLAADLEGGFEQCPTTIEDHARRDQRWCQGNLQHVRIAVSPAWHPVSRWHFFSGAMSYLASPLWLMFLLIGVALHFISDEPSNRTAAITVFSAAMTMLFFPKFLAIAIHVIKGATRFGGALKLTASTLAESLVSMAVSPIMMLYHSRFVFLTLIGKKVRWNAQVRTDDGIGLGDAIRSHGVQTLIGISATCGVAYYSPELLAWASPLFIGLVCAIPLGQLMASPRVGSRLAKMGLLLTPEETSPPRLLRRRNILVRKYEAIGTELPATKSLFGEVLRDPTLYRLHHSLLIASQSPPETANESNQRLSRGNLRKARRLIRSKGIESIPPGLRRALLSDPHALRKMHLEYWSINGNAA